MDCYCASKTLYKRDKLKAFRYLNKQTNQYEDYSYERDDREQTYDPHTSVYKNIYSSNLELGGNTYPVGNTIQQIEYSSIVENPAKFYRDFIALNKPCKILNGVNDWPAMKRWGDLEYLKREIGKNELTVDVTPDGFADSIYNQFFAQPKQVKCTFQDFLNMKASKNQGRVVPYIQKQNNNLSSEFSFFLNDIRSPHVKSIDTPPLMPQDHHDKTKSLPDLKEFFKNHFFNGKEPDSTNFWMGYSDSVSALHKDPYENIYTVIHGEKHFTLAPPAIYPYSGVGSYKNCKWNSSPDFTQWWLEDINDNNVACENSKSEMQDNEGHQESSTMWYSHNPDLPEDHHRHFSEDLPVYHVIVKSGEVLYLPSLWFHQVTQFTSSHAEFDDQPCSEDFIIATNFWYDMEFDHKFLNFDIIKNLVDLDISQSIQNVQ